MTNSNSYQDSWQSGTPLQFLGIFPLPTNKQQLLVVRIDFTDKEVTQALPCHYVLISDMEVDGMQGMPLGNNAEISLWAPIKRSNTDLGREITLKMVPKVYYMIYK